MPEFHVKAALAATVALDSFTLAGQHAITLDRACTGFFDGALLGNGGMGVVVRTRPDAILLHFGHNNVWDIRIAEKHRDEIGTFEEVLNKVKAMDPNLKEAADDPWYREYNKIVCDNYSKPYPRPMPCGSVILGFDRRRVSVVGHRLEIDRGVCRVHLLVDGRPCEARFFTDMDHDQLWIGMVDAMGRGIRSPFDRICIVPDTETPREFPRYAIWEPDTHELGFRQVLPALEPDVYDAAAGNSADRAFRLTFRSNQTMQAGSRVAWNGQTVPLLPMERYLKDCDAPFIACVRLEEGMACQIGNAAPAMPLIKREAMSEAEHCSTASWRDFWGKSAVKLDDAELESVWYRNLYFLHCSCKPGVNCPGLFANWSLGNIGSAWHGDYHFNYNVQQPFWVAFSSNHLDKHLPYVDMVDFIRPLSRDWARDYYSLRGACYPHSAYPVKMTMSPYPTPCWGWEVCETPWAVQTLWWHYLYTQDKQFLRDRVFEPLKEVVEFLVDYLRRPDCRGAQWGDDFYHVYPAIPPELYALQPGLKYNYDCLVTLCLIRYTFAAFESACRILGLDTAQRQLLDAAHEINRNLTPNPTAQTPDGETLIPVPGALPDIVQNTANTGFPVFPCEGPRKGVISHSCSCP